MRDKIILPKVCQVIKIFWYELFETRLSADSLRYQLILYYTLWYFFTNLRHFMINSIIYFNFQKEGWEKGSTLFNAGSSEPKMFKFCLQYGGPSLPIKK